MSRRTRRHVNLAVLAALALALPAAGQWSSDPLDNNVIADRPSEQVTPKIAVRSDGGCYVAWFDLSGGSYAVWLQRLGPAGYEAWPHNGILVSNHAQMSWLVDWDLECDAAGNAVVVFSDLRDGGDLDVHAYRLSSDGDFLWGPDGIALSDNADFEPAPRVALAGDGDLVFVWARLPDAADGSIMMQRVAPDGTLRYAAGGIEIAAEAGKSPSFCDVAPAGPDGVVVSWLRDTRYYYSDRHLRAERFAADGGSAWGAPAEVYDLASLPLGYMPELRGDGAGGAVLAWHASVGNMFKAYLQRLDQDGTEAFAHNGLQLTGAAAFHHLYPTPVHDAASGETFVFWDERNSSQSQWGIFGQRVSAPGDLLWGPAGEPFLPVDALYKSFVRALPAVGGAMCFWIDEPAGYGSDRIRGFRVDAEAAMVWPGGIVDVSLEPSVKGRLPVAVTPAGAALLIWEDDRAGTVDVYGQNVSADGVLGAGDTAAPGAVPAGPALLGSYPNPFNPKTTIRFVLPATASVELAIFAADGRRVATLLAGEAAAGDHEVVWAGRDDAGRAQPTGIYLARLIAGDETRTGKLILLK